VAAAAPKETPGISDGEAEYAVEYAAVCPACEHDLTSVTVIRLLRTRVNFTSTLPRHGRALICPNCRTILSAGLSLT
jgi:RNase P subunit RPR2